jgi:hypothetical protein
MGQPAAGAGVGVSEDLRFMLHLLLQHKCSMTGFMLHALLQYGVQHKSQQNP